MNTLLLSLLGLILLIFCVVDLLHLNLMYKKLKEIHNDMVNTILCLTKLIKDK